MAWRLAFDGVNDRVEFPTALSVNLGTEAYSFECSIVLTALPPSGNFYGIVGRSGTTTGFAVTSDGRLAMYSAGSLRYQTSAGLFLADSVQHVYRLEHDAGGAWRVYRDNLTTPIESGTYTSSNVAANMNRIGTATGGAGFLNGQLAYVDLQIPVGSQRWDADLSGGAGTTLPTVSGTNQGTLVNFTVPDCWVFYSSGDSVSSSVAAAWPMMLVSATQSQAIPSVSSSVAASWPMFSVAAVQSQAVAGVTSSVSATWPMFSASVSQFQTIGFVSSIAVTWPIFGVAASQSQSIPSVSASVSFSWPMFGVSAVQTEPGVIPAANPAAFVNRAYVGGRLTNSAKIGGRLTNNATVAI